MSLFSQKAPMKRDTCIQIAQDHEASKKDICKKSSDNETDKYFLFYMHAVFCKKYFFKVNSQRKKPKCAATDHESFVVSITLQYVACIIYMHNINKGSQKSGIL